MDVPHSFTATAACTNISDALLGSHDKSTCCQVDEVNKNVYTVSFDKPAGLTGIRFNHVPLPQIIQGLRLAVLQVGCLDNFKSKTRQEKPKASESQLPVTQ